jgi:mRNA interferase RelE/StbE
MHRITFKKSVSKDLAKISKENLTRIFHKMEKDLSENPEQYPELKGKFAGLRKYRVGDYRILFVILEDKVLVTRVKLRREAYK